MNLLLCYLVTLFLNYFVLSPLSANPTKRSNTLKQFVGNFPTTCLSVFDHFVGLALKGLIIGHLEISALTSRYRHRYWYQRRHRHLKLFKILHSIN